MSAHKNRRKSFGKLERPDKIIEREKAQKVVAEHLVNGKPVVEYTVGAVTK